METEILNKTPIIALIHNISKNQIKYLSSKIAEYNLGKEIRYIMMIYDNPNCSQEDLVNLYGESKANIAKSLKKLENQEYIERKINPNNRRKYMLKTTPKADELVPKVREISKEWEKEVGIDSNDEQLKEKLKLIAINGMKLIGD
ncbi:MAG: winged helix-turn-helix transcriptional regulator [Methanobrevibacter thaueri]|nr:winged helix-turn-helix transcriptional regulator [Methanobrevibacter thaueri]